MQIAETTCVPPGFRFHPTEEELVGYYLNRKVNSLKIDLDVISDVDLYKIEPWDIQEKCNLGYAEQNEWYFFSFKDRKYPTGTRTNRATAAGFWKATGRDKAVLSKEKIIGMRKTLVFYKGRAPNGRKTDWIMHEYRRLQTSDQHGLSQEQGWVVCRAFKKPTPSTQKQAYNEPWNNTTYCLRSDNTHYRSPPFLITNPFLQHSPFDQSQIVELPSLDSPSVSTSFATNVDDDQKRSGTVGDQYSEWKSFDKMLDSQVTESSSFEYTNMAFLPTCDELDAQNRISNVLDCFSDL